MLHTGVLQCRRCVGVNIQFYTVEKCRVVGIMLLEELVISLCNSIPYPSLGCFFGVYTNVCLRVVEIGVEVNLVVGVGSDVETNLIGTFNSDTVSFKDIISALCFSFYTYGVFHTVVVELSFPQKLVVACVYQCALRDRVRSIAECEVLHSGLACAVLHYQYIGGVRYETFALKVNSVPAVLYNRQGRIE